VRNQIFASPIRDCIVHRKIVEVGYIVRFERRNLLETRLFIAHSMFGVVIDALDIPSIGGMVYSVNK